MAQPFVEHELIPTESHAHGSLLPSARELRQRTARREITERRRLIQRLRQALATGGFIIQYQPLASLNSGLVRGAEALIRLRHNRRGLVAAGHFMPVAERSELMPEIGAWMLRQACAEAANWPACVSVALSLSPAHLHSGHLVRQLLEALNRSGMAAERLELELSESMLIDDDQETVFCLRALQGLGVRLALNNFGLGYASLSALKRLPITTLRLDRSLIQNLGEGGPSTAILRAAIDAGHALGCTVLADGVEHEAQFRQLGEFGCDEGQGAYFGPVMDAALITTMLAQPVP